MRSTSAILPVAVAAAAAVPVADRARVDTPTTGARRKIQLAVDARAVDPAVADPSTQRTGRLEPRTERTEDMAKYLILIYGDEAQWEAESQDDRQRKGEAHGAFAARATSSAGTAIVDGGELEPSSTATSLRARSTGGPSVTDAPFLETKEVLGGYYVLEAPDLDQALALAKLLPEVSVAHSGVEIRPVRERS